MSKHTYFLFIIPMLLLCSILKAQEPCSQIKIAVNPDWDVYYEKKSEVYDFFQKQYGYDLMMNNMPGFSDGQTEEEWQNSVHDYLFDQICQYNPDVHFVSKGGDECDYSFTYHVGLIAIDNDTTWISATGYQATGSLSTNNACGENRYIDVNFGTDDHLSQAIKNMISQFGLLDRVLYQYEKDHIAPPRGPKISPSFKDKNYVSPLKEDRKIEIYFELRDCRNQLIYQKGSTGQEVYLERRTKRATLRNNIHQQAAFTIKDGNPLILGLARPKPASVFYELKKGINPEMEKIAIGTCGRDRMEIKSFTLPIYGLEILVRPGKTAIKTGESTPVNIYFNCVHPEGTKKPIANKQLSLSIKGLKDGSVSPSGTVTTDADGKATLQYKAGENDERVTISASFQPEDYPDKVTGSGSVSIIPDNFAWTGSIDLEITRTFNCDIEEPVSDLSTKRIIAGDHNTTYANISIGLSDFNLPVNGTSAGAKLQYISGQVTVDMSENHSIDGNAAKTQCHNDGTGKWEWISPGNWSTRHETMAGQAYADIGDGSLNLLITKEMLGDKDAMQDMQQKVAEIQQKMMEAGKINDLTNADKIKEMYSAGQMNIDKQALEKLKDEMRNTLQGDQNDATIPVKAVIEISMGGRNYPVYTSRESEGFNVCTGEFEENESNSETIEMPLILPINVQMKGTYTRGKNGNDRIEATINDTKPFHATFGSGSCPEGIITINGSITLERNKN